MEEWKPVLGHEKTFSISNVGRLRREVSTNASPAGKILVGSMHGREGKKYIRYALGTKRRFAHAIVLEAFCGLGIGLVPHHKNNIGTDNRVENLQWVTPSENTKLAYADGCIKPLRGANSSSAKLTAEAVAVIREKYRRGWSCSMLADVYGINKSSIHRVVTGKTWREQK